MDFLDEKESPTCGHTDDNNKKALIGILSVSLIASVTSAAFIGYEMSSQYLLPYHILQFTSLVIRVVGISVGIAGASRQDHQMLMAFFVMELIFVAAFLGTVLASVFAHYNLEDFVTWWLLFLSTATLYLTSGTMALAWQSSRSLSKSLLEHPRCGHTKENNKKSVSWLCSVAILFNLALIAIHTYDGLQCVTYCDKLRIATWDVPAGVSVLTLLFGIIAIYRASPHMLTFYFFLELLCCLGYVFAQNYITGMLGQQVIAVGAQILAVVPLFQGAALALAWQARAHIRSRKGEHYINLAL